MEQRILDLEKKMAEMEKDKANIAELVHACMELQGTVQRQTKQLQKQRKEIAGARENMISLQKYADAKEVKPAKMISPVQNFHPSSSETQVPRHILDNGSYTYDKIVWIAFAGLTSYIVARAARKYP